MKILNWIIALCGLWEFGDIAAVFVPGFGRLPVFLWNHIIAGLVLMILGAWAARTRTPALPKQWIGSPPPPGCLADHSGLYIRPSRQLPWAVERCRRWPDRLRPRRLGRACLAVATLKSAGAF